LLGIIPASSNGHNNTHFPEVSNPQRYLS
jgi:hypothetical protein